MSEPSEHDFEQLLEANKEKIYRICRIYAIAPLEPQDLFQEVIFQVWKSFSSFKGKSSVSTWIYRIALNVCHRAKTKLGKEHNKLVRMESIHFLPQESDIDEHSQERYQALHSCISSLNDADKSIIVLHLEELPYKEIASITGLSENYVAVKMTRIRKLLFDCITHKLK